MNAWRKWVSHAALAACSSALLCGCEELFYDASAHERSILQQQRSLDELKTNRDALFLAKDEARSGLNGAHQQNEALNARDNALRGDVERGNREVSSERSQNDNLKSENSALDREISTF